MSPKKKKKETKPKPLDLKLTLENFGPLGTGQTSGWLFVGTSVGNCQLLTRRYFDKSGASKAASTGVMV